MAVAGSATVASLPLSFRVPLALLVKVVVTVRLFPLRSKIALFAIVSVNPDATDTLCASWRMAPPETESVRLGNVVALVPDMVIVPEDALKMTVPEARVAVPLLAKDPPIVRLRPALENAAPPDIDRLPDRVKADPKFTVPELTVKAGSVTPPDRRVTVPVGSIVTRPLPVSAPPVKLRLPPTVIVLVPIARVPEDTMRSEVVVSELPKLKVAVPLMVSA